MTHTHAIPSTMKGAYLPGDSTVALKDIPVPEPGHGEVLIRTKSSTICGSDIRAIYHEHPGRGQRATIKRSPAMSLRDRS